MTFGRWSGIVGLWLIHSVASAQPDFGKIRPRVERIPVEDIERVGKQSGLTDCFWIATVSPNTFNILFPDSGVVYWGTQLQLPDGATLELTGQYPRARHISFSTYNEDGQPVDRVNDLMLEPEPGHTNPFMPNARRDLTLRDYRVRITRTLTASGSQVDETTRPPNTLFAIKDAGPVQLWYRVYVPDKGTDVRGGVPLPMPVLKLADGRTVQGDTLCREIVVASGAVRDVRVPAEALKPFLALPGASSQYHPAQNPPSWHAFFNPSLAAAVLLVGTPYEGMRARLDTTRRGGFYSTLDNTYMSTYVDNRFGEVLVLRAKAPSTPRTYAGSPIMRPAQLRYWSLCKYRSLSDTAVENCLYDEQVPVDPGGTYTIVMSVATRKPVNATPECGVGWLDWGIGDGIENPSGGLLVLRHMMPAPDFKNSLFSTQKPGDEASSLGEYFPVTTYMSKTDFEKKGCTRQ